MLHFEVDNFSVSNTLKLYPILVAVQYKGVVSLSSGK